MTIMKWDISGQGYKQLTRFKPEASTMQKINPVGCFNLFTEGFLDTFISCYLKKIIKIGFPELEKNFSNDFALFS